MLGDPRNRWRRVVARARRLERRELRRWLERTRNLLHLTVLVVVPLVVGALTYLSNTLAAVSFLLFPPLASGTYTLFADPEGKYSSPRKFVGGMTLGALSGWLALELTARFWYNVPPGEFRVHAGAAALGVFLTGLVTWRFDLEEPTAFSTALLVVLFAGDRVVDVAGVALSFGVVYVVGVAASSAVVAAAFSVWRRRFYERRARYLYGATRGDDHVLVPMRGDRAETVAAFGARLAAAHEAGKVVLLDLVDEASDTSPPDATDDSDAGAIATADAAAESFARLERVADRLESEASVPCETVGVAATADPASVVVRVARERNCDLVVTPLEMIDGEPSAFAHSLLGSDLDVVAMRPDRDRTEWRRVMVPVRGAGEQAHAMIDFALRLAGAGTVAACHCIDSERERRRAEELLATLVESFPGRFETRVARADVADYLERTAPNYDLTIVGASTHRSTASRILSPPTFERLDDLDCDLAVVHKTR